MKVNRPLGKIDLWKYLENKEGIIKLNLTDAGMVRSVESKYTYEKIGNNTIKISKEGSRIRNGIVTVNRYVDLTPNFIVFIAMYDGDGNKTNNIGFAQNEHHLQNFVTDNLKKIFGNSFTEEITILEDLQYFKGGGGLEKYKELKKSNPRLEDKEIYSKILAKEFTEKFHESLPEYVKFVISPLKGARSPGQSSYEIIRNLKNSRHFLPFFLSIVKDLIKSIFTNTKNFDNSDYGIEWYVEPKGGSLFAIDTKNFVIDNCRYFSNTRAKKYEIVKEEENSIILKKPQGIEFHVYSKIPISPLLCAMLGLYWAEGTTTKSKFFTFHTKTESLVIGFNSSEEISLNIFFEGIGCIFPKIEDVFSYWIVKIGTKYFAESNALAFKLLCPAHRAGNLGQGISRALEITEAVRDWGLTQSSDLKKYAKYFRHIEFTGNGIPRIDLRCRSAAAAFLFTIMRQLSFEEEKIEEKLVENE